MLSNGSGLGNSSVVSMMSGVWSGVMQSMYLQDGTYTLVSYDDNYETYLKSMGIPWLVVPLILRG